MAKIDWDALPDHNPKKSDQGVDWDALPDAAAPTPDVSQLESVIRGLAQGASLGFADEATGSIEALWEKAKGNPTKFGELYAQKRNESREAYKSAEAANPMSYGAGQLGGMVGTAFIPGLNAGTGAKLGATIGKAALQGGLAGAGATEDSLASVEGLKDVATGSAFGGLGGLAGYGIGQGINKASNAMSSLNRGSFEKGLSKAANLFAGVDEEAAARTFARPAQSLAAQSDDFAYKLGKKALGETEALRSKLGSEAGAAGKEFVSTLGDVSMPNQLSGRIDDFLSANAPSKMGFSSISDAERKTLEGLSEKLKATDLKGEDLYKLRGYLDHVERLAGKYDQDGVSPFVGFLKSLRGEADAIADAASPRLDAANKAYSQFLDDTSILRGATNESQAEGMINNLYGANKTAKQEAAARLFSPETMESAKDIAASKAFEGAKRPGGDNYFRRGALGALTFGGSELVTSPDIWQKGLRTAGRVSTSLPDIIKNAPQTFGRFAPVLQNAAQRGTQALGATHFVLQQTQPEYQKMIQDMDGDGK